MNTFKKKTPEQRKDDNDALKEKLVTGILQVYNSETFKEYLQATSKFWNYSFNNRILIYVQNPEATRVASFKAWKSLERSVNAGKKGMKIMVPYTRDFKSTEDVIDYQSKHSMYMSEAERDRIIAKIEKDGHCNYFTGSFSQGTVFDIAQTSGKELPELSWIKQGEVGETYEVIKDTLISYSEKRGCHVDFKEKSEDATLKGGALGYYSHTTNGIVILKDLDEIGIIDWYLGS